MVRRHPPCIAQVGAWLKTFSAYGLFRQRAVRRPKPLLQIHGDQQAVEFAADRARKL